MSSSRHSTVTFNGTPLENTASSLASIDTPVRAMAKVTIGDDLGVSDVPRQICQRSVETQQIALAAREQRKHQWTAASVSAQAPGLPDAHPGRLRRHRPTAQRTTSTTPRVQDTITSTRRGVALTA